MSEHHVDPRPSAFTVARSMGVGAVDTSTELVHVVTFAVSTDVEQQVILALAVAPSVSEEQRLFSTRQVGGPWLVVDTFDGCCL